MVDRTVVAHNGVGDRTGANGVALRRPYYARSIIAKRGWLAQRFGPTCRSARASTQEQRAGEALLGPDDI